MNLNIEELKQSPNKSLTFEINEPIKELDENAIVEAFLTATIQDYGVNISGKVQTNVTLECDRCLKKFNFVVNIDIDEKFINDILVKDNIKEFEIKNNSFAEDLNDKEIIDIKDLIYQNIILSLPLQKLCSIDCKGSKEYQKHLNEEKIDPRLEIFKQMSEDNIKR